MTTSASEAPGRPFSSVDYDRQVMAVHWPRFSRRAFLAGALALFGERAADCAPGTHEAHSPGHGRRSAPTEGEFRFGAGRREQRWRLRDRLW